MLRIHFTEKDFAHTSIAARPDPLWETVLGVQKLVRPGSDLPMYAPWQRRARAEIAERSLGGAARLLATLATPADYFPDFLTPPEAAGGLDAGLEALRGTSRQRLGHDIAHAGRRRSLPRWAVDLGCGDRAVLDELTDAVRLTHDTIIAPAWARVEAHVDADRQRWFPALCEGGVHRLLDSLRPALRWEPPVLIGRYPARMDIHLNGRGLRLIPSYFCWGNPVALVDPQLPPTVVYPVTHDLDWVPAGTGPGRAKALAALLGRTRAGALAALTTSATTGDLARRLGISNASASEHASVLRQAGLVYRERVGGHARHRLTPLGRSLLDGDLPGA